eukprot:gnl/TRDRNA2_/TRDRNA2_36563_c0_seq1.p1 gnl/TRDRNA2_/TRDRNA2_36563_c0~~gnl/TRDRNA2_/TRDRNA2_36563_c0_seq1.p1  ORF type:complete len:258 (+),score=23.07 gnl/TRDRNA2_/TRDRNA2_36563_c0_seq1:66-776(+)
MSALAAYWADKPLREHPLAWEEIYSWIERGQVGVGRSAAQVQMYNAYKDELLKTYATVADFMLVEIFRFDTRTDENARKIALLPEKVPHGVVWKLNDFPYYLEDGIEHHCMWSMEPLTSDIIEEVLRIERPHHEVLWYVNPAQLRSIPELEHAQVLSRNASGHLGRPEVLAGEPFRGRRVVSSPSSPAHGASLIGAIGPAAIVLGMASILCALCLRGQRRICAFSPSMDAKREKTC